MMISSFCGGEQGTATLGALGQTVATLSMRSEGGWARGGGGGGSCLGNTRIFMKQ